MWANNEVGTVQPVPEVVAVAAPHGIPVHTDAVQAVGTLPVDFAASGVDALFSLLPPENATGNFTKVVQRLPVRIAVPEQGILNRILREVRVPEDQPGGCVQPPQGAIDQFGKGLMIAPPRPVDELIQAAAGGDDGRAACGELSATAKSTLERQEKAPCEEAILRLDLPRGATAAKSRVYLRSGSVDLVGGGVTFLNEGPAGWKISAAGCTRGEPGRPYDCELEG